MKPTTHACAVESKALPPESRHSRTSRSGRPQRRLRGCARSRQSLDDPESGDRSEHAERRQAEDSGANAEVRQDKGRGDTAERIGALADTQRNAALAAREPVHDRPAARGAHARAGEPGNRQQDYDGQERVCERREDQRRATRAETDRDHDALTDAIGDDPPRKQREH